MNVSKFDGTSVGTTENINKVKAEEDLKEILNTIPQGFLEDQTKQLNVFITGVGNVGERLVGQIKQQQSYLKEELKINIRIIGLSNSRKMIFDANGLSLKTWKEQLSSGEEATIEGFFQRTKSLNLYNSVFVDITANEDVSKIYAHYLKESIAVITCNKIACSGNFESYRTLKKLSAKYTAAFLFDTNIGAGLPVIATLNHLIASGDKITSIHAALSGSLNFVFNNFNANTLFHDVVKQAQQQGYTEPDPRIDLSGLDVARKILILARESGVAINLEDIENDSFVTDNSLHSDSVDDFYKSLLADERHFQNRLDSAKKNDCQLKYVAEFNNGKAKVGLREIAKDHPFYNLQGKDNIVMFYTQRYPDYPLTIKGAGAGADVTALGLFGDIIRLAK